MARLFWCRHPFPTQIHGAGNLTSGGRAPPSLSARARVVPLPDLQLPCAPQRHMARRLPSETSYGPTLCRCSPAMARAPFPMAELPQPAVVSPCSSVPSARRRCLYSASHGALLSSFSVPDRHLGSARSSPSCGQQHPLPCCCTPPLHSLATKLLPASMRHPWSSPMD